MTTLSRTSVENRFERDDAALGLGTGNGLPVEQRARVALAHAAHMDELAADNGEAGDALESAGRVRVARARHLLCADDLVHAGALPALGEQRGQADVDRPGLDDDDLVGHAGLQHDIEAPHGPGLEQDLIEGSRAKAGEGDRQRVRAAERQAGEGKLALAIRHGDLGVLCRLVREHHLGELDDGAVLALDGARHRRRVALTWRGGLRRGRCGRCRCRRRRGRRRRALRGWRRLSLGWASIGQHHRGHRRQHGDETPLPGFSSRHWCLALV